MGEKRLSRAPSTDLWQPKRHRKSLNITIVMPGTGGCPILYVFARGPHGTGMGHPELILVSKDRT